MGASGIERFEVSGNRIVVKQLDAKAQTDGGIYLPDQARKRPLIADVILPEAGLIRRGMRVVYSPFAGIPYRDVDGQEYLILDVEDVLLVEKL